MTLKPSLKLTLYFMVRGNSQKSDEGPLGLPAAIYQNQILSSVFVRIQELPRFPAMFMDYRTQIFWSILIHIAVEVWTFIIRFVINISLFCAVQLPPKNGRYKPRIGTLFSRTIFYTTEKFCLSNLHATRPVLNYWIFQIIRQHLYWPKFLQMNAILGQHHHHWSTWYCSLRLDLFSPW
jgi:hypothetical protein